MIYEYKAKRCPELCTEEIYVSITEAPTDPRKERYDNKRVTCTHGYALSRVFSPRVVSKYKTVHMPGTSKEREFTSRAEFARFLRDESRKQEDYTGIPTEYEPIDLHDPSVLPPDDSSHEDFLRETHDAQIRSGEKVPSSFLVSGGDGEVT